MIPVIISGGSGSRLWPVSRQLDPKPFIKLADGHSLLQSTFLRAIHLEGVSKVLTVTNEKLFSRMQTEYQQVMDGVVCDFILEPFGRNTAPAVLVAGLSVATIDPNEILLVLPADHLITDSIAFKQVVNKAIKVAQDGYLVTFGITPNYPETGYGYIEANKQYELHEGFLVKRFVEKPNLELAQQYLDSGDYLWNSGMFLGKAGVFLEEFKKYAPQMYANIEDCINSSTATKVHVAENKQQLQNISSVLHLNEDLFAKVDNISIDYALFEKSDRVAVVPCNINWSDVGSWLSVAEALPADKNGNVVVGESILHNTDNCLIYSTDRIVATVDLKGLIIVDTPDAVLVADKNNSQNVRHIFEHLKSIEHHTYIYHKTIQHTWGDVTQLDRNDSYVVNKVKLKANGYLKLIEFLETMQQEDLKNSISSLNITILSGSLALFKQSSNTVDSCFVKHINNMQPLCLDSEINKLNNFAGYELKNETNDIIMFILIINYKNEKA